jgi:NAD(P)-dependent dehydrogenase (short-subunit alcohol dehydrogenase family)
MTPSQDATTGSRSAPPGNLSAEELATCVGVLRVLAGQPALCDSGDPRLAEVRDLAAQLLRASRAQQKRDARQRDQELLDSTGIRTAAHGPQQSPSSPALDGRPELSATRTCYVCKRPYARLHVFYDCLCPECGEFNHAKRLQSADLSGRVALLTGGRVKIGYQTALKLLRAGASVVITTRFPHDAARRYVRETDFSDWGQRLRIHAIDLRHLLAVESLAAQLNANLPRLDVIINNAAQTVRRPPAFYRHLLEGENSVALPPAARQLLAPPGESSAPNLVPSSSDTIVSSTWPALLSQLPLVRGEREDAHHFPPGGYDGDGQQIDLRPDNSWALQLGEVSLVELLEVHAVNALAPFILLRHLEPLLLRHPHRPRYVVNVSAMEGQFNAASKTGRHPHTNMAKAGLNMLTRTCAGPYAERGIYMNSVDPGWSSNEAPRPHAEQMAGEGFRQPLDAVDGAARVLDPVFTGINTGVNEYGKFWKDYRAISW